MLPQMMPMPWMMIFFFIFFLFFLVSLFLDYLFIPLGSVDSKLFKNNVISLYW